MSNAQAIPHVRCVDVWTYGLPEDAKNAYATFAKMGELQVIKIVVSKTHPIVVFEYLANTPHQWALESLASFRKGLHPYNDTG